MAVNGSLYDVTFFDGTCSAIFDGCDQESGFVFDDYVAAQQAGQALPDQVFIDGPLGLFDSDASLTTGCDTNYCTAMIPFGLDPFGVNALGAANNIGGSDLDDANGQSLLGPDDDLSVVTDTAPAFPGVDFAVYARFSVVPEPSASLLFSLSLLALCCARPRLGVASN